MLVRRGVHFPRLKVKRLKKGELLSVFTEARKKVTVSFGAVVQKQLRHSDPRITLGVYAHVISNQQLDAVEHRSARIEEFAVN